MLRLRDKGQKARELAADLTELKIPHQEAPTIHVLYIFLFPKLILDHRCCFTWLGDVQESGSPPQAFPKFGRQDIPTIIVTYTGHIKGSVFPINPAHVKS